MALEDFKRLWGEYAIARTNIEKHQQDQADPEIYNTALERILHYTGQDLSSAPGQPPVNPQAIRGMLRDWSNVSGERARDFANGNLEAILNETDEEKLIRLAIASSVPHETGEKTHDEVAEIHKKYREISSILQAYNSENRLGLSERLKILYSGGRIETIVRDLLTEKDNSEELSEEDGKRKGAMAFYNTILYSISINPEMAIRVYEQTAVKYEQEMLEKLGGKAGLAKYIADNAEKSADKEKENLYDSLYSLNAR